jgi:hypothetical protein
MVSKVLKLRENVSLTQNSQKGAKMGNSSSSSIMKESEASLNVSIKFKISAKKRLNELHVKIKFLKFFFNFYIFN